MLVRNNYEECLTNLACSIQKYFGLEANHNSIDFIDKLLEDKQPKNVVVLLFDGMGARILDRTLEETAFFNKNKWKDITTVFPATTTSATTSVRTGLHPIEHGWLGWNMYVAPIKKTITLFLDKEKGKEEISEDFLEIKDKLIQNTIVDQINRNTNYEAIELFPFGENKYQDLDDMLERIKKECNKKGKKYIYGYDTEPDHTMHDVGAKSDIVKQLIRLRNDKVEKLCKQLTNTIVFVLADHGHIAVEHIYLKDYPQIMEMLERTTSLEQRAVSFKIKDGYKEKFVKEFKKYFCNDFNLYSHEEVVSSHLFGYGKENCLFRDAIGDFIAIAETSNKCLITEGDKVLVSQHAGYTEDEIYVPLIIIDKC